MKPLRRPPTLKNGGDPYYYQTTEMDGKDESNAREKTLSAGRNLIPCPVECGEPRTTWQSEKTDVRNENNPGKPDGDKSWCDHHAERPFET